MGVPAARSARAAAPSRNKTGEEDWIMVLEKLKQIIAEQFGIDTDAISEDTDIVADLGADSLDVVEMMMALEEEYGVTIDDSKIADLKTVGDVAACVEGMI